jgi:short-subunit dehydrogenase
LHSLTQHLAMELADLSIRVNAVSPAVVVTPIYTGPRRASCHAQTPEDVPSLTADVPLPLTSPHLYADFQYQSMLLRSVKSPLNIPHQSQSSKRFDWKWLDKAFSSLSRRLPARAGPS